MIQESHRERQRLSKVYAVNIIVNKILKGRFEFIFVCSDNYTSVSITVFFSVMDLNCNCMGLTSGLNLNL